MPCWSGDGLGVWGEGSGGGGEVFDAISREDVGARVARTAFEDDGKAAKEDRGL